MRARARRALVAVGAVVIVSAAIFVLTPRPFETVPGLSHQDVLEIKSVVRQDLWHQARPTFTWASLSGFPRQVWEVHRSRIGTPTVSADGKVYVSIASGGQSFGSVSRELQKKEGKWEIVSTWFWYRSMLPTNVPIDTPSRDTIRAPRLSLSPGP
jgi:hypothetical protein